MVENFEDATGQYQYGFILPFEKNYEPNTARQFMERNWHLSFYFSAIYVAVIFGLKYLMTNSKPFSLKSLLLAWNISLAALSIVMFCRTLPEFMHTLNNYGIYNSVCISRWDWNLHVKSLLMPRLSLKNDLSRIGFSYTTNIDVPSKKFSTFCCFSLLAWPWEDFNLRKLGKKVNSDTFTNFF